MSEYSKLASESMKNLTERVIKADLSQRKGRMLQAKAMSIVSLIYVPFGLYFGYVNNKIKFSIYYSPKEDGTT
jgi:hypothetical protein